MPTHLNEPLTDQLRATLHGPRRNGDDQSLSTVLRERHPADVAEALRNLAPPEALAVFNQLDDGRTARVLSDVGPETTRYLLEHTSPECIATLVARLPMDDAAWVVSRASLPRAEAILTELSARTPAAAEDVRRLLTYGEATAGRLMTEKFVRLSAAMTVEEAFAAVRRADPEVETLTDLYVVDTPGRTKSA